MLLKCVRVSVFFLNITREVETRHAVVDPNDIDNDPVPYNVLHIR